MPSPPPLSDVEMSAWQGLLHTHHEVMGRLDAELREAHGLTMTEYDVLVRLARADGRSLRMSEVAERILMSVSGLSRAVDGLERRGLVERQPDADDARARRAALTEAGLSLVRMASRTHVSGIREHFTSHLTPAQLAAVGEALEQVVGPHEPH